MDTHLRIKTNLSASGLKRPMTSALSPANANGVPTLSPGLERSDYPGKTRNRSNNPEGVAAIFTPSQRHNPFRVEPSSTNIPRVARTRGQPWAERRNAVGVEFATDPGMSQRLARPHPSPLPQERERKRVSRLSVVSGRGWTPQKLHSRGGGRLKVKPCAYRAPSPGGEGWGEGGRLTTHPVRACDIKSLEREDSTSVANPSRSVVFGRHSVDVSCSSDVIASTSVVGVPAPVPISKRVVSAGRDPHLARRRVAPETACAVLDSDSSVDVSLRHTPEIGRKTGRL